MIKLRKNLVVCLAAIAATTLSGCNLGKGGDVSFWSSFGAKYRNILNDTILPGIEEELGVKIEHTSKGSYPNIRKEMVSAIANSTYPDIAVGYPDHFAQYHGSNILVSLDGKIDINDYDPSYMAENYLYDKDGTKHLYGVPFNKSTELLGYNGIFVDYCAEKYEDPTLKVLPTTWDEWASTDPESKVQKYKAKFDELVNSKKRLFGVQDAEGHGMGFELSDKESIEGKKLLLDYTKLEDASQARLFSWDSTDNAFITLVRQWGAEYTKLPEDQRTVSPKMRQGKIMFANSTNLPKVVDMLKFFNGMYKNGIFCTPSFLGGTFSSDAFSEGRCMFMVCSSGGLSYNTENWENRFSVAPIPYKDAAHKLVISQGANICMTKHADEDKAIKVIKALTQGKFQTEWAIQTGYFPASNTSADTPEYQAFLNSKDYSNPTLVTYREGARVNENEYRKNGWTRFVDDAFIGSAVIREQVASIIGNVFLHVAQDNPTDADYEKEINDILKSSDITGNTNIVIDRA